MQLQTWVVHPQDGQDVQLPGVPLQDAEHDLGVLECEWPAMGAFDGAGDGGYVKEGRED